MKKNKLICAALALCFALLPLRALAVEIDKDPMVYEVTVSTFTELQSAIKNASTDAKNPTVITIPSNMEIRVKDQLTIDGGKHIVIKSDSETASATLLRDAGFKGVLFEVGSYINGKGNLTLTRITLNGYSSKISAYSPLVYVLSGGKFTARETAFTRNINRSSRCAGVLVGGNGSFQMENCTVSGVTGYTPGGFAYISKGGTFLMDQSAPFTAQASNNRKTTSYTNSGFYFEAGSKVSILSANLTARSTTYYPDLDASDREASNVPLFARGNMTFGRDFSLYFVSPSPSSPYFVAETGVQVTEDALVLTGTLYSSTDKLIQRDSLAKGSIKEVKAKGNTGYASLPCTLQVKKLDSLSAPAYFNSRKLLSPLYEISASVTAGGLTYPLSQFPVAFRLTMPSAIKEGAKVTASLDGKTYSFKTSFDEKKEQAATTINRMGVYAVTIK